MVSPELVQSPLHDRHVALGAKLAEFAGWQMPLEYAGGPHPLDLDNLLAAAEGDPRAKAGAGLVVGHVHLHVGDLEDGLAFYRDVLGFELIALIPDAAAFVSAGGYHHHLGFNLWRGRGVPAVPGGRVGLRHWTVVLQEQDEVDAVRARVQRAGFRVEEREGGFLTRDPWDIPVAFVAEGPGAA